MTQALRALALQPSDASPLPSPHGAAILLLHLGGTLLVARLAHWPPLLMISAVLGMLALSTDISLARHPSPVTFHASRLTPLALAYLVAALRLLIAFTVRVRGAGIGSLLVPQPWGDWLNLDWAFAFGAIWAVAIRLPALWRGTAATLALSALAFGWSGYVYFHSAPSGVTGSDPYAYVQMGVDLAERGTLLHSFPLASVARDLGLPIYPMMHIGYRVPIAPSTLSATVWPPGFSVLLAVAYRAFGERGLYLLNPILGLAALGATVWLALVLFRDHPRRWAIGALAALWLATSLEQTTRLLVPLADIAGQLFTTMVLALTLWVAPLSRSRSLRTGRAEGGPGLRAFLSGLTFGWAYFVRYTQLLLAPAILYLAFAGIPDRRRRLIFLLSFGVCSLVVAIPDLWYALFRMEAIPAMAVLMAREFFAPREFLWALPFVGLGLAAMWRGYRRELIALCLGFGPLILFHLPYPYLRLRDLLPLFPALALIGSLGAIEAIRRLMARGVGMRIAAVALIVAAPLARWESAWPLARGFFTFGFLFPEQRAALGHLADLTPPDAVIAASLNSGAVELYARRATVRPASWNESEFDSFLSAMRAARREVYLLADGVELEPAVARLRASGRLTEVATLPGVYFQREGGSQNMDLKLYRIEAMIQPAE
ncbi:MAG: hypothetical protein HY260_00455 [Chloroflexi bacterium]|nr:hypothetical protein [Chloroflexota bacterium]